MKYDKIILELLSRIQVLEEQITKIKSELASHGDYDDEGDEEDVTRSQARAKAIEVIQNKFPDYLADVATRKEGSGIKLFKPDADAKRPLIIKFYHSKSFRHRSGSYEHSWHVVRLNDVMGTIIDLCMFSYLESNGRWNYFIYDPNEIGMYRDENRSEDEEILHLYFVVKDGKGLEVREGTVDVTEHLNNWDVLE